MLRGGGVLVALALIAGALVYSVRYTPAQAPRAQTTPTAAASFLPLTGLGCVRGAAWDPTSTYLAFLGTPDSLCGIGGYTTTVVNVYRVRTATLVRQLHPDAALFAALGLPQPRPVTPQSPPLYPQLTYDTLLWSPDGRRLAMTFDLDSGGYNPTTGQLQVVSGLVLLDADGGNERVLVDHQTGPQAAPGAYIVWDVQAGTTILAGNAPPPSSPNYNGNTLPLALSYTWSSGGSLVPGPPLSRGVEPPSLALDLVGNPVGGHSFGLWQPGQVQVYAVLLAGQQTPPTYLYLFQTTFAAWSPDGRYFVNDLSIDGLLLPAGQPPPTHAVLSAVQIDQAAQLPVRDAALQQALAHDLALPASLGSNPPPDLVPLAWRPDGKVLAILNQDNGVTLCATATGRIVKSVGYIELPPAALPPSGVLGTPDSLLWSPDGHWLLLPSLALLDVGPLSA